MTNRKPPASLTGALLARKGTATPAGLDDKPFDRTPLTRVTPEAAAAAVNLGGPIPGDDSVVGKVFPPSNGLHYANGTHESKTSSLNGFRTRSDIMMFAIAVVGAVALGWGFNAISGAFVGENDRDEIAISAAPSVADTQSFLDSLQEPDKLGPVSEALHSARLGLSDQNYGIMQKTEVASPDGAWRPVALRIPNEESAMSDDEAKLPAPKPSVIAPRPTPKPDATLLLPQSVPVPLPKPQWVQKLEPSDTPWQDAARAAELSLDESPAEGQSEQQHPSGEVKPTKDSLGAGHITSPTTVEQDLERPLTQTAAPRFAIQLSAVGSAQEALRERKRIESTYHEILGDLRLTVAPDLKGDAAKRYRIQSATSFGQEPARSLCAQLAAQSEDCAVVAR